MLMLRASIRIAGRSLEGAADCSERLGHDQQARFIPAFSHQLNPNWEAGAVSCEWQHDGWVAGVIEGSPVRGHRPVRNLLTIDR